MNTYIIILDGDNNRCAIQAQKYERDAGTHWVFTNDEGKEVARFGAGKVVAIIRQDVLVQP